MTPSEATELEGSGGRGWKPPCPPSGTHHYRFTVYAFPADEIWSIEGDPSSKQMLARLADEAIAWGRLTGTVTTASTGGGGY